MQDLLDIAFPGLYEISRVHGGDINESFLVRYSGQEFFIKYNVARIASDMFQAESLGLETIEKVIPRGTPEVIRIINDDKGSMLIMKYIPPGNHYNTSQNSLGRIVGKLHLEQSDFYGLEYENYIGTLSQSAGIFSNFATFYLSKRLLPQIKSAVDKDLLSFNIVSKIENLEGVIDSEVPTEPACLIHGDLWGGNYLINKKNEFILIDPAISYSHREMDIAMTLLFGGFNESFYSGYQETIPLDKGWKRRASIFQLYYLLVHLNLFGISYKPSVESVLKKWLK